MAITTEAVVQDIRDDSPSVYTLMVKPQQKASFQPGHFFFIQRELEGKKVMKAYSVASVPDQDVLEFCIKQVDGGYMSNALRQLKKGETIIISGPYGFFTLQEIKRTTVFLATGTGIAALRPMIHTIFKQGTPHQIWLLFGVRTQEDILYKKEFEQLAQKHKNFHFIPVLSRERWEGEQGHVQGAMLKYIKDKDADYYACGLFPMVDEVKKLLLNAGVPAEQIHAERYV